MKTSTQNRTTNQQGTPGRPVASCRMSVDKNG